MESRPLKDLTGADMLLDEASVTSTANIVIGSCLSKGKEKTTAWNKASASPILQIAKMPNPWAISLRVGSQFVSD
jgi:UDP-N-acetylglucosamine 1-carboxyvinyltransferase